MKGQKGDGQMGGRGMDGWTDRRVMDGCVDGWKGD